MATNKRTRNTDNNNDTPGITNTTSTSNSSTEQQPPPKKARHTVTGIELINNNIISSDENDIDMEKDDDEYDPLSDLDKLKKRKKNKNKNKKAKDTNKNGGGTGGGSRSGAGGLGNKGAGGGKKNDGRGGNGVQLIENEDDLRKNDDDYKYPYPNSLHGILLRNYGRLLPESVMDAAVPNADAMKHQNKELYYSFDPKGRYPYFQKYMWIHERGMVIATRRGMELLLKDEQIFGKIDVAPTILAAIPDRATFAAREKGQLINYGKVLIGNYKELFGEKIGIMLDNNKDPVPLSMFLGNFIKYDNFKTNPALVKIFLKQKNWWKLQDNGTLVQNPVSLKMKDVTAIESIYDQPTGSTGYKLTTSDKNIYCSGSGIPIPAGVPACDIIHHIYHRTHPAALVFRMPIATQQYFQKTKNLINPNSPNNSPTTQQPSNIQYTHQTPTLNTTKPTFSSNNIVYNPIQQHSTQYRSSNNPSIIIPPLPSSTSNQHTNIQNISSTGHYINPNGTGLQQNGNNLNQNGCGSSQTGPGLQQNQFAVNPNGPGSFQFGLGLPVPGLGNNPHGLNNTHTQQQYPFGHPTGQHINEVSQNSVITMMQSFADRINPNVTVGVDIIDRRILSFDRLVEYATLYSPYATYLQHEIDMKCNKLGINTTTHHLRKRIGELNNNIFYIRELGVIIIDMFINNMERVYHNICSSDQRTKIMATVISQGTQGIKAMATVINQCHANRYQTFDAIITELNNCQLLITRQLVQNNNNRVSYNNNNNNNGNYNGNRRRYGAPPRSSGHGNRTRYYYNNNNNNRNGNSNRYKKATK